MIVPDDELEAHINYARELQRTVDPTTLQVLKTLQDRHDCARCGKCCAQPVGMLGREAVAIARYLGIPASEFRRRYIVGQHHQWLQLMQVDDRCPFLERDGELCNCSIYEARPEACRRFPFLTIQTVASSRFPAIAIDDSMCPSMRRTFNAYTGGGR
jgi:Fe-S-cluster containining protein